MPQAQSIWSATADPAPETTALEGARRADVAIVGAGFTGLTAALSLAEGGAEVIVVDSFEPGFGASGRNGGQVIPGLKHDPDTIDALFGEAATEFAGRTADTVFSLIEKYRIDCDPVRSGWIQASVKKSHMIALGRRMRQWQRRGADAAMLDGPQMTARTGGTGFVGGWIDRRGGGIHPLNYVRGLTRAATGAGARIHGWSKVTALKRGRAGWMLEIGGRASIEVENVIVATNGYTGALWPGLKATVIPANSFQVATSPLGKDRLAEILPERNVVSDSRRVGNYFRIGPGGRLMMGGRGGFADPQSEGEFAQITETLHAFFPQTRQIPIEFRWAGRVATTSDRLPHVHQPAPGMIMALGYNGRGVALASAIGIAIGEHLLDPSRPLPLKFSEIKPMPLHGLHEAYASAAIAYYRFRDWLER